MKLNFIQNLSDQVVRQNYELKASLQQIKRQLNDYQEEMIEVLYSITAQNIIHTNPKEILRQFTRIVQQEQVEFKLLKHHTEKLRESFEQLQKEAILHIKAIKQKNTELMALRSSHEAQLQTKALQIQQLQAKIEESHQMCNKIIEEMSEIKIEKLKLEEYKRKEVEQIRKYQNSEIINFRESNEKEHMDIQKSLRKELQMREKTIKELSKVIAQLTNSNKIEKSEEVLAEMFAAFQSFDDLTQVNKELKQENQELRKEIKSLYNRLLIVQSNLQEEKSVQYNLLSQVERLSLEKQEIEGKLILKINEISKTEKDKEAMELYYDERWNSEYKKVKMKLQKSFKAQNDEREAQSQEVIKAIQNKLKVVKEERKHYLKKCEELQSKINNNEKLREQLLLTIKELHQKILDLRVINKESSMMSFEELQSKKILYKHQKVRLLSIISTKEALCERQTQKLKSESIKHAKEIVELRQHHRQQIKKQELLFSKQREVLTSKHTEESTKLKDELEKYKDSFQHIRSMVENEYNLKLQTLRQEHLSQIKQKQDEFAKNNERWIDKHCELQHLLSITRRKLQEQLQSTKLQLQKLLENQYHLHNQIELLKEKTTCLQVEVKSLQAEINSKTSQLAEKQNNIIFSSKELCHSKKEVEMLLANRKLWKSQLLDSQRQTLKEFQQLKQINKKITLFYKEKVHELEGINRKITNNRKQTMKIEALRKERLSLKSEIHLKEAENVILHQMNDYYQTKIKETDRQIGKCQFKNTHAILTRRVKKKTQVNESNSHRIFEPREYAQRKRYAISSVQKQFDFSESNSKLKQSYHQKRVQTMSSLK